MKVQFDTAHLNSPPRSTANKHPSSTARMTF